MNKILAKLVCVLLIVSTVFACIGCKEDNSEEFYCTCPYCSSSGTSNLPSDGNDAFLFLNGTIIGLTPYGETLDEIVIPKTIDGQAVIGIGHNAFENYSACHDKKVTIPDSVKYISSDAFYNSYIGDVNYLGTVDQWAKISFASSSSNPLYYGGDFYIHNQKVTQIEFSIATYISDYAFYGADIEKVIISNRIQDIGKSAFSTRSQITIYCEQSSKPSAWAESWNGQNPVVWNYINNNTPSYPSPPYVDPTPTQLYIGIKDDGIGKDWVYDAIEKFEQAWANWQNPSDPTRVGVQVIPKFEDSLYEQKNVETSMPTAKESVYVLSSINFYQWLNQDNTSGMLVNLWDVANKDPDGEGPERSIYDRMSEDDKKHLTVNLPNGEKAIYNLPYHENYWGAIYDADIFEEYGLYNLDEYVGIDGVEGTADDCWGPNGVPDNPNSFTCDDGLPATWEDMKVLIYTMAEGGIIPFTWNQNTYTYQTSWLKSIMAAYEGKANYELRYSMNGTHSELGEIDKTNAYKLADAEGIRAALTVAEFIRSNSAYYSAKADYSSQSHLAAQEEFIMSTKAEKPIGFLLESGWWENKAKGTFASMVNAYGEEYGYGKRNFRWFPFPKFIGTDGIADQSNTKITMFSGVGTGGGGWMLSANVDESIKPLALDFIKFCNSEQMMARFTEITGICRPYEYEMTDTQIANMTPYARSVCEYRALGQTPGSNVELVRYKTRNPFIVNVSSYFGIDYEFDAILYKGENNQRSANNPLTAFKDDANLTVEDYIEGIKAQYNKVNWESKLSNWYDEYDEWLDE